MNKKELVGALADHCGTTQAQAGEFVNAFCEIVTNEMKKGDKSTRGPARLWAVYC